jgi:copper transporter 1
MPGMTQCKSWSQMCNWNPLLPFCPNNIHAAPTMKMFFHFGIRDYVLFETWVPESIFEYLLTCLACFGLAAAYEYLLYMNSRYEKFWKQMVASDKIGTVDNSKEDQLLLNTKSPTNITIDRSHFTILWTPLQIRICRSCFRMINMFVAYLCMLIVMSFNVGLFLALILGVGFGSLLWNDNEIQEKKAHCF